MRTHEIFDPIRGPWFAVATDVTGFVLTEDEVFNVAAFIVVGRGSAEPIGNRQMPETADLGDVLYELDLAGTMPAQVMVLWQQAKDVAETLNGVQTRVLIGASSLGVRGADQGVSDTSPDPSGDTR